MTPQEALAQALATRLPPRPLSDVETEAAAILDALPDDGHGNRWVLTEEWRVHDCDEEYVHGITAGAKRERERLREKVRAVLSREDVKNGIPVVRAQWLVDVFLADPKNDR